MRVNSLKAERKILWMVSLNMRIENGNVSCTSIYQTIKWISPSKTCGLGNSKLIICDIGTLFIIFSSGQVQVLGSLNYVLVENP